MDEYLNLEEPKNNAEEFKNFRDRMTVRLQKRAELLAQAEQDFDSRVKKEAEILADKMIRQARNERDNARQKAKRLQHKLAVFGIT
jgi:hypothetical protein